MEGGTKIIKKKKLTGEEGGQYKTSSVARVVESSLQRKREASISAEPREDRRTTPGNSLTALLNSAQLQT